MGTGRHSKWPMRSRENHAAFRVLNSPLYRLFWNLKPQCGVWRDESSLFDTFSRECLGYKTAVQENTLHQLTYAYIHQQQRLSLIQVIVCRHYLQHCWHIVNYIPQNTSMTILFEILYFLSNLFMKMHLKMSLVKSWSICLGFNMLSPEYLKASLGQCCKDACHAAGGPFQYHDCFPS